MKIKYSFRQAEEGDIAMLVEFNCRMAMDTEGKILDKGVLTKGINNLLTDLNKGFYIVAEHLTDGVVGALMVTKEWSEWRNGYFWWIQSVFVKEEHRRKGVYSGLYSTIKNSAKMTNGCCGLRLYVEKDNIAAQSTYIALGMKETNYRFFEEEF